MSKFPSSPLAALFLLLTLLVLGVCGCSTTETENASARPWNSPSGWENGMPGGMMQQGR